MSHWKLWTGAAATATAFGLVIWAAVTPPPLPAESTTEMVRYTSEPFIAMPPLAPLNYVTEGEAAPIPQFVDEPAAPTPEIEPLDEPTAEPTVTDEPTLEPTAMATQPVPTDTPTLEPTPTDTPVVPTPTLEPTATPTVAAPTPTSGVPTPTATVPPPTAAPVTPEPTAIPPTQEPEPTHEPTREPEPTIDPPPTQEPEPTIEPAPTAVDLNNRPDPFLMQVACEPATQQEIAAIEAGFNPPSPSPTTMGATLTLTRAYREDLVPWYQTSVPYITYVSGWVTVEQEGSGSADYFVTFEISHTGQVEGIQYGPFSDEGLPDITNLTELNAYNRVRSWFGWPGQPQSGEPYWKQGGIDSRVCANDNRTTDIEVSEWECAPPAMARIEQIEGNGARAPNGRLMEPWQTDNVIAGYVDGTPLTGAISLYDRDNNRITADTLDLVGTANASRAFKCAEHATNGTNPASKPADAPRWEERG